MMVKTNYKAGVQKPDVGHPFPHLCVLTQSLFFASAGRATGCHYIIGLS
jgi:hypothetical protein